MQPSKPNAHGVLEAGVSEVVAKYGRASATIRIAVSEDGLHRFGVDMRYANGGFSFPISIHSPGYAAQEAARTAALEQLLRSWHSPLPSDPKSVHTELDDMRRQVEERLRQPTLF